MTLVVDASVVINALGAERGLEALGDSQLIAPPLMWSETRATLRLQLARGTVPAEEIEELHERLERCAVRRTEPAGLGREAWKVAGELGWGRTYAAEYVALGRLAGCRLVTVDARLRRGADRLGMVVIPSEL